MLKINTLAAAIVNGIRCFKSELFKGQFSNIQQYGAGGEDYNPPENTKALAEYINNNPGNGVVIAYQDGIQKIAKPGEKRIYSVENGKVVAEIHLTNDKNIVITAKKDVQIFALENAEIVAQKDCNIIAENVNIDATKTNIGAGGKPIARIGDSVEVDGKEGVITSGGENTSV